METFGTNEAIEIAFGPGDRAPALKNLYQRQLRKVARFVRYFEMRDKNNRVVYYLFFATNNSVGHVKMKESMWKVDPLGDFSFSDATNPDQQVLFSENPRRAVSHRESSPHILAASLKRKSGTVEQFVQDDTAYLRSTWGNALKLLEKNGDVVVADKKADGKKRVARRAFPNNALITFKSAT